MSEFPKTFQYAMKMPVTTCLGTLTSLHMRGGGGGGGGGRRRGGGGGDAPIRTSVFLQEPQFPRQNEHTVYLMYSAGPGPFGQEWEEVSGEMQLEFMRNERTIKFNAKMNGV